MAADRTRAQARRITLVADELRGIRGGGLGTVFTFLGVAIARLGHQVEVLYFGEAPDRPIDPFWADLYERSGVRVRMAPRSDDNVEPSYFARMLDIDRALSSEPPDVVVAQDLAGPAYVPLRRRQLGLGFENTLFVVRCSGTRRWITEAARKVRVLPGALAITVLEQAALELADAVVAESQYMVEWMKQQGWRLPARTRVIPSLMQAAATGEPRPRRELGGDGPVKRLAFFGRLEERKGVRPFIAALNALEPALLQGLELEFIGPATPPWPPSRVQGLLSETTTHALRDLSFTTDLDREEALSRLDRPGTLAVMPSLEDNSPSTVYECLELGIPFIASHVGGTAELIDRGDRPRVLFEPTPEGIEAALRRMLSGAVSLRPARPAFDDSESLQQWAEVVTPRPASGPRASERPPLDVIVVRRDSAQDIDGCLTALARDRYPTFGVILVTADEGDVPGSTIFDQTIGGSQIRLLRSEQRSIEGARQTGLRAARAPWIVFLDADDTPSEGFLETLVQAQAASGADVVTCGLFLENRTGDPPIQQLFLGEPGGLAVLSNTYGNTALIRRSLLVDETTRAWPVEADPDWPLLARLSASGARIVSIPIPLVTRRQRPGDLNRHPSDALLVVKEIERTLPAPASLVAHLAAGLASASAPAFAMSSGEAEPRRSGRRDLLGNLRRAAGRMQAWLSRQAR